MNDDLKHLIDAGAVGTGVAVFFDALPHLAAMFTCIWLALRCWESWLSIKRLLKGETPARRKNDEGDDDDESDSAGV
jgi:hypothetical protein